MKGWSYFVFFRVLLGQKTEGVRSQRSSADFQYGLTVKSHFAVWSSSKSDSQYFDPALNC